MEEQGIQFEHLRLIVKACLPKRTRLGTGNVGLGPYLFLEKGKKCRRCGSSHPRLYINTLPSEPMTIRTEEVRLLAPSSCCLLDLNDQNVLTRLKKEIRTFLKKPD